MNRSTEQTKLLIPMNPDKRTLNPFIIEICIKIYSVKIVMLKIESNKDISRYLTAFDTLVLLDKMTPVHTSSTIRNLVPSVFYMHALRSSSNIVPFISLTKICLGHISKELMLDNLYLLCMVLVVRPF